jgi:hypothetical protein
MFSRRTGAVAVGATLIMLSGAVAPGRVGADERTPSWIDPAIQLEPIASTGCTIGDPSFFSHMVVSDLPSKASEDPDGVDHYVQGLIDHGGRKVVFPSKTTSSAYTVLVPSLKPIWDNQQKTVDWLYEDPVGNATHSQGDLDMQITPAANWTAAGADPSDADSDSAYSLQPYGIPINILTSTSKMVKYYTYPLNHPSQSGAFLWGWTNGQFVKLETVDAAHSQVAEYYGSSPQPDTWYPHPAFEKYQGFPQGANAAWDNFALAAQPQTDGSCDLFETQGLNEGHGALGFNPTSGYPQAPWGASGAMKWNTATMRQDPAQRRQGLGAQGQLQQKPSQTLGANASRTPITSVLTRLSEVQPGHSIDHVMYFFSTGCDGSTVWPARQADCGTMHPDDAPYGTVFRLPASYDPSTHGITDPAAIKIVDALKVHGMMLLGTGSDGLMMESANCPKNAPAPATTAQCWGSDTISQITHIAYRDLEAVDTSGPGWCQVGGFRSDLPTDVDWFHMYGPTESCPPMAE